MKAKNVALFLVMLLALTTMALPAAGLAHAAPIRSVDRPTYVVSLSTDSGTICPDKVCGISPDGISCKCRINQLPYFKTPPD